MPATIPNDWPDEIKLDVVTPLAYLKTQAANLEKMTEGIIRAVVRTVRDEADHRVAHSLELVAPALQDARKVVLIATHDATNPYPVNLEGDGVDAHNRFDQAKKALAAVTKVTLPADPAHPPAVNHEGAGGDVYDDVWPGQATAQSYPEFRNIVRAVLRSGSVLGTIHSFIARVNEAASPLSDPA